MKSFSMGRFLRGFHQRGGEDVRFYSIEEKGENDEDLDSLCGPENLRLNGSETENVNEVSLSNNDERPLGNTLTDIIAMRQKDN